MPQTPQLEFPLSTEFVGELARIVGRSQVLTGAATKPYCVEPTSKFNYQDYLRVVVVLPGDTDEVARVVSLCRKQNVPLVPRGGGTGLVGANVPRDNVRLVLSLERLKQTCDQEDGTIIFGAGVTMGEIHAYVREHYPDKEFGINYAAQEANLGGLIATNAGGMRVVRYGMMADQVLDIEYVLANGTVVHLRGLVKHNDGYHLERLLPGSEGTLAVITAARLRLHQILPVRAMAALSLPDVEAAVRVTDWLRRRLFAGDTCIRSLEYIDMTGVVAACDYIKEASPVATEGSEALLMVELAGTAELKATMSELVQGLVVEGLTRNIKQTIFLARTEPQCQALWRIREGVPQSMNTRAPLKYDISLPPESYAGFVKRVPAVVSAISPATECIMFGHIADGTVHLNILGVDDGDWSKLTQGVLGLVATLGGSISSEHGRGTKLAAYAVLGKPQVVLEAEAGTKRAWDPQGILNPGAVIR